MTVMHILFLSDNFPPEVNAPASRTFEHCREWVKAGHKVTVVTCAPNFPSGKVFGGYKNKLCQQEVMEGIQVIRIWTYITANEGFLKRVLDYLSYMVMAILASFFVRKVDVVIGTSPQFFTACAAYVVGLYKRCPWVFELRDLWPESIRAVGAMKEGYVLDWLEKTELFLYRKASLVVSVTNAFKDHLVGRGINPEKIYVITNGVDLSRFSPRGKDRELLKQFDLEGKFVAGYIGTHGMAHGLGTILDAAKLMKEKPNGDKYRFLMLGDGAEKPALMARARDEELVNVIFLGTVPKDQVVRYWSILDVSIIQLKNAELFKTVIPSKLFESMAMSIPVVHGVQGESESIVRENKIGTIYNAEDPASLCSAITAANESECTLLEFKRNAEVASKRYQREMLAKAMLDKIASIME